MKNQGKELDEIFDKGEDISPYLDLSIKERPSLKHVIRENYERKM